MSLCVTPRPNGSSPLARGTHSCAPLACPSCRLIPARAGNTSSDGPSGAALAAHPRSRGEHYYKSLKNEYQNGSSPLARGTHYVKDIGRQRVRLIPARAGNTNPKYISRDVVSAHPRSRGEHEVQRHLCTVALGSSPLARGTRTAALVSDVLVRLIPARAGNTLLFSQISVAAAAHPRSRGEHGFGSGADPSAGGSSPLARGTPKT